MRRMKVNAQVTAMTTALEFLGSLTYFIHLVISKGTNLANFIHFQSIYFIVIPYAFLMNTSNNKFRVIQNGWKGVFRNVVGKQDVGGEVEHSNNASDKISIPNKDRIQKENTDKTRKSSMVGTKTSCMGSTSEKAKNVTEIDILSIADMCAQKVRNTNNGQGMKCIDGEVPNLNLVFTLTRKLSPKNRGKDKRDKSNDLEKDGDIFIERVISNRSEVDDHNMPHTPHFLRDNSSKAYCKIDNRNAAFCTLNVHQLGN